MIKLKIALLTCIISFFMMTSCKKESTQTIPATSPATMVTDTALNITPNYALINARMIADGGLGVIRKGVCWSKFHGPTIDSMHAVADLTISSGWIYSTRLTGLATNTLYYVKAFEENAKGIAYGNEITFITKKTDMILLDSTSFSSVSKFESLWNYLYPWGSDHNGSARMYKQQITLDSGGIIRINADRIGVLEGKSTANPYLQINYHSGAIYLKQMVTVTDSLPVWTISGDFQSPVVAGSWPAFWMTGVDNWPPETDIMEFKGSSTVWQNTATGPDWSAVTWQGQNTVIANAGNWHNYKITMTRVSSTDLDVTYSIDNAITAVHRANFMNKRFYLIINMQMEGSSGSNGPTNAVMKARNLFVSAQQL